MDKEPDSRTLLAHERTFLSWMRTGISLMAFGFVLAKFTLYLSPHLQVSSTLPPDSLPGLLWIGAGIAVISVATLNFRRVRQRLSQNQPLPPSRLPFALAGLLAALGVIVFFYLVRVL